MSRDYTTSFFVDQSPEEVFAAIKNVRGWWSQEIEGPTDQPGASFQYHFQDVHRCTIQVVELVPAQKVVWHVLENDFSFVKDKTEWVDTQVVFEISRGSGKTELRFTHVGLVAQNECYNVCSNAWNSYVNVSLRNLIVTGKGQPNEPQGADEAPETNSFTTFITVDKTPDEVFAAINNVRAWWTGHIEGVTDRLGGEFTYQFQEFHFTRQKITELVPGRRVVWLVTEANLSFTRDKTEWAGTQIVFSIRPADGRTLVRFTHQGLVPEFECFGDCSAGWRTFINGSLFHLLSTGKPWAYDFAVKSLLGESPVAPASARG